jgi:hypothetical protein
MTTAEFEILGVEPDEIIVWRTEQLERVGYPPPSAVLIATHFEVDLHTAVDLVRRGCPVQTALRILL